MHDFTGCTRAAAVADVAVGAVNDTDGSRREDDAKRMDGPAAGPPPVDNVGAAVTTGAVGCVDVAVAAVATGAVVAVVAAVVGTATEAVSAVVVVVVTGVVAVA